METVSDLTADSFLACLKRFISRRGEPHSIYSDNATNFTKINKELQDLKNILESSKSQIIHELAKDEINDILYRLEHHILVVFGKVISKA